VMHQGRVLQQGTPEELFTDPAHTFVGYFIGSPGMNFLPCRVDGDAAVIAGHPVPLPADLAARARRRTGALILGIRPELVSLARSSAGDAGGEPGLPVRVGYVEDHGRFRIIAGTVEAGEGYRASETTGSAEGQDQAGVHSFKLKLDAAA